MDAKKLEPDIHRMLPGKSILVMGQLFSEAEHYIYYSTDRFMESEKDRTIIWISTDTPYGKIREKFTEYGFKLEKQEEHPIAEIPRKKKGTIQFLDMISHRAGVSRMKCDDCTYVQDPSNLTDLSLAINSMLGKSNCGLVVVDSLNSLLVYNDLKKTLKFMRFLSAAAYERKMTLLTYLVSGEQEPRIETSIKMAADAVIMFEDDHMTIQSGASQKSFRFEFSGGNLRLSHP